MLPGWPKANCRSTANLTSLTPFMRRIWPSHMKRRFLIAATRLKVRVRALASACASLPVNLLRHRALAPFIIASVFSVSDQASHPYVNSEQIAVLYIFSFSRKGMLESNTCRSAPMRCMARAILRLTSLSSVPSAVNTEPKYLNVKVFLSFTPSQSTGCFCF